MSFLEPTSDARFIYELAEHLHKTVDEIVDMQLDQFTGWKAYFAVKAHEAAVESAKASAHRGMG